MYRKIYNFVNKKLFYYSKQRAMKRFLYIISLIYTLIMFQACATNDDSELYQNFEPSELVTDNISDNTTVTGEGSVWDTILVVLIALVIAASIVYFFIALVPLKLWFQARLSKVRVSWFLLIKMKWQNIPQSKILYLLVKNIYLL